MYEPTFFQSILDNKERLEHLKGIRFHRVIDNEEMELSAEDLWTQLNYHLIHFVDFLPVANWQTHRSDPLIQIFIQLSQFLDAIDKRLSNTSRKVSKANQGTTLNGVSLIELDTRQSEDEVGHQIDTCVLREDWTHIDL